MVVHEIRLDLFEFVQKELRQALRDLARASGANIVLDVRCQDKADFRVTASLNEVRLFPAVRLLADMAELRPVFMDDVYYVTSIDNANRIEKELEREYNTIEKLKAHPGVAKFAAAQSRRRLRCCATP